MAQQHLGDMALVTLMDSMVDLWAADHPITAELPATTAADPRLTCSADDPAMLQPVEGMLPLVAGNFYLFSHFNVRGEMAEIKNA